jgi:hypothetical protein
MREFFHGWRRKIGCLALVMACIVSVLWVRSLLIEDVVVFFNGFRHQTVDSLNGDVYWDSQIEWTFDPGWFTWFTYDLRDPRLLEASLASWEGGESMRIPYWSVAVPLTLLSAYLILWKPRRRT